MSCIVKLFSTKVRISKEIYALSERKSGLSSGRSPRAGRFSASRCPEVDFFMYFCQTSLSGALTLSLVFPAMIVRGFIFLSIFVFALSAQGQTSGFAKEQLSDAEGHLPRFSSWYCSKTVFCHRAATPLRPSIGAYGPYRIAKEKHPQWFVLQRPAAVATGLRSDSIPTSYFGKQWGRSLKAPANEPGVVALGELVQAVARELLTKK